MELLCHVDQDVPQRVIGDGGRLRQIVMNLVGNSIKFTEAGEIVVTVEWEAQSNGHSTLYLAVSDTGVGIPPEKQARIFEAFEQADTSMTRKYGGTGLGLAICSQLVNLMGGRIWVESEMGSGSTFHVSVPVEAADSPRREEPPSAIRGTRVLIVDDNATNRRILGDMLAPWDLVPSLAASADEAWQMLSQARQADKPYELVLVDADMPERRWVHARRPDSQRPAAVQNGDSDAQLGRTTRRNVPL